MNMELNMNPDPGRRARAGFTLIELLAVMAIVAILSGIGVYGYRKFQILAEERQTTEKLVQLKAMAEEYEVATGDFPPDIPNTLGATTTNDINTGIEVFVAVLSRIDSKYQGNEVPEAELINTDEDKFAKKITRRTSNEAYEAKDSWGNPVVYFSRKSYGKKQRVLSKERGTMEFRDFEVAAAVNTKTKDFKGPNSYQLISAGYDGRFGTADDIVMTGNQ